ncbi:4-(cytidine 5'-diphospho)-2-C-methyl-D-erythritol kinase [Lacibacter sp. MH-610]|uniref:4-(cytidine 5'-diphospho)-2-C-methyl-D-erythritol kinase n=1 Tax=Lacibacter sp. MH-610 TaxID=3020883 RepID=UPI003891DC2D
MIVFPNCKINLGLQILNKREDGYHNLATIFYPIGWKDIVEVVRRDDGRQTTDESKTLSEVEGSDHPERSRRIEGSNDNNIHFSSSGLEVAGDPQNNLCIKAYQLLKKDFPSLPPVHMHLHKTIPMGAGLGGGSADGAFTLKLLNEKFQLGLSTQQLINYALQLGSDCPFFILNKPVYATGRGEIMEPVNLDLSAYQFVIVNPGIHVNTGWAFAQLELKNAPRPDLRTIVQQPIHTWKEELINDFEAPVCKAHPETAAIKQQLYDAGALYASMTGSGSTVFGMFEKGQQDLSKFFNSKFTKVI